MGPSRNKLLHQFLKSVPRKDGFRYFVMAERDDLRTSIAPLSAENYCSWSNDMEVLLRGEGLWNYLNNGCELDSKDRIGDQEGSNLLIVNCESASQNGEEAHKRDLALAYILTSDRSLYKVIMRKVICPCKAWSLPRTTYQAVFEAAM